MRVTRTPERISSRIDRPCAAACSLSLRYKEAGISTVVRTACSFMDGLSHECHKYGILVRKETHEQMLRAQISIVSKFEFPPLQSDITDEYKGIQLSYGLGLGLYHTPRGWAFFKEGHDEGWRTYLVCHQNQGTCMVILTNSSNGEGIYSALLKGLLGDTWNPIDWEVLTPYDKLPPRKPLSDHTVIQVPPTFLAMLAGRYGTQNDVLTVEAEGDHLSVVGNSKRKREFFPQTWTIFFSKDSDETLTFLFDIDTWAFRILREVDGKGELIPNLEWALPHCDR